MKRVWPWLLIVLGALGLAASFNGPKLFWLAFIGLVPLFFGLRDFGDRKAFWGGALFGFLFFGGTTTWILNVFPWGLAGANNVSLFYLYLFFIWFLHALVAALPIAAFSVLAEKAFGGSKLFTRHLLFGMPGVWVLNEYVRAWLFTVINWGPGSIWGAHWTFGHLGYAMSNTPFLPLAKFIGLYGLGWLVVYVNVLAFLAIIRPRAWRSILQNFLTIMAMLALLWFWDWRLERGRVINRPIRAVVAQTDSRFTHAPYRIGVEDTFRSIREISPAYQQPDVIVFPEYFLLFAVIGEKEIALLKTMFPNQEQPGLIVTSATGKEGGARRKNIIYINQKGEILGKQSKRLLMPGGEYLSYLTEIILRLSGKDEFLGRYLDQSLEPGGEKAPVVKSGAVSFGGEIMYGVVSPTIYSNFARQGAEILISPASFTAFRSFPPLLEQITRMAKTQSAKTYRPLLQAADSGFSLVIDQRGRIIRKPPSFGNYLLEAVVMPDRRLTPAVRFGEWVLLPAAVLLIFPLLMNRLRSRMEV